MKQKVIHIPKAELHVHLEGATKPSLIKQLAATHKVKLPEKLYASDTCFYWDSFATPGKDNFIQTYDLASSVIRTREDYRLITYAYLKQTALEGGIYVELTISADHAAVHGLSYSDLVAGVSQGIAEARQEYGIEARMIVILNRHLGVDAAIKVAKTVAAHPHPEVVGIGLAGDEARFPPAQFAPAFHIAKEAGLQCTAHAGEMVGPEGIYEAINNLPITRIGHGVRCIEDPKLMDLIIEKDIVLECAPTSNIALAVYPNYAAHPLLRLYKAGIKVTLNSDDPPFWNTTLGKEYEIANHSLGFDEAMLIDLTRTAITHSFADQKTKQQLLAKI